MGMADGNKQRIEIAYQFGNDASRFVHISGSNTYVYTSTSAHLREASKRIFYLRETLKMF